MPGVTVSSIDLSETFDPDSSKQFLHNQYTVLQSIAELLTPGYFEYLDKSHLRILQGILVPLSIP